MSKRGIALFFTLLITLVLLILLSSFFYKTFNENNLLRRYVSSTEALWAAERGVADAMANLPGTGSIGPVAFSNQSYTATYVATPSYRTTINSSKYYDIISTGTAGNVSRTVSAIVKTGPVDPSKFKYGIDAANDLCFGGGCHGDPNRYLDPTVCPGGACWKDFDNTINFSDLFGYQQSEVSNIATHYTDLNFPGTVNGVTWVDVTPGLTLMVTGNLTGNGVLIINGNVHFGGDYQFHGIIYVLGTLTARGTFDAYGSVVVASTAGIDSINGTPTFHYDQTEIIDALNLLSSNFSSIVSWREI